MIKIKQLTPSAARLCLLVLICLLAVVLGVGTFPAVQSTGLFQHTAYWWMAVGVSLWAWMGVRILIRSWGESSWSHSRRLWFLVGLLVLVSAVTICLHNPAQFKVINDEPVQLLTAESLFKRQEATMYARGYDIGSGFEATYGRVDKRPILYAWMTAMTHTLTGHRLENGFYLNRFFGILTIVWLLVAGRRLVGDLGGALLALLCLLPPMFAVLANSGGFEMLNFLLIVILWHAIMLVLERPSDADRLGWLAMTAGLLIHCRYESILFLLPAAAAVLLAWWRSGAITIPWTMLAAPLMAIPRFWLQKLFQDGGDTWQLNSKPEAMGRPFSFHFFYDNIGHALSYFFSTEPNSMNSILLAGLGAMAIGFWVLMIYKQKPGRHTDPSHLGSYLVWAGLGLYLLLMMLYFWGQFDDLATQRLAFPVHLWLAIAVAGVLGLTSWGRRLVPAALVMVIALLFGSTIPQLERNLFVNTNYASRAQNWIIDYGRQHPQPNRLVIDGFGGLAWLLTNNAVTSQQRVLNLPKRIRYHWEHHTFSEVLVFQRMHYHPLLKQWVPLPDELLGPDFKLEPVAMQRLSPIYGLRLMRLVEVLPYSGWKPSKADLSSVAEASTLEADYQREWLKELP